jgi:acyl-coenzyme A synthetase/AMP-(fatty) acid ligase
MARGYLDQQLSAERFVDGWYLTDDLALMHHPRQVLLQGRSDTMINIGGHKVSPEEVEGVLLQACMAENLAVSTWPNSDGIEELYVLVADISLSNEALIKAVVGALGGNFGHVRIARVDRIPRSVAGKVQRAALRALLARLTPSTA